MRRAEGGRVMIRGSDRSAEITEGDQRQRETQQASGPPSRFPGDNTWGRAAVITLAGRRQIDTDGGTDILMDGRELVSFPAARQAQRVQ